MTPADASFPHLVIRASAGTGKTFQLSNRFLGLTAAGIAPDHILATTFARKAAGEILDRILTRLAKAVVDENSLRELRMHLEGSEPSAGACRRLLFGLISELHRLRIGTLDSFFVQLGSAFGLELGLPTGWRIVDELDDQRLRTEAVREVLRQEETSAVVTLMHLLSKGDVVRSVSSQIQGIVANLYGLYRESSAEAWHKIPRTKPLSEEDLQATLAQLEIANGFGDARFDKARRKDLDHAYDDDWEDFIKNGLAKRILAGDHTYYKKEIDGEAIRLYEKLLEHAKSVVLDHLANRVEAAHELLEKFDLVYRRLKLRSKGLRFDDVTWMLAEGFSSGNIGSIAYRLDGRLDHLLLDEFQDTSRTQWNVLEPLAELVTRTPDAGGHPQETSARNISRPSRSFFCVGDVKQAIYGWRGGVTAIFDAVTDSLPGLTTSELAKSYRSSQVVIDAVNEVFDHLPLNPVLDQWQDAVDWWSERFVPHATTRKELEGEVRLLAAPQAAGSRRCDSREQRQMNLFFAADEIARLVQAHPQRTVGVLVRTNAAVARLIHELRSRHDIRASEEGGNPLTDSAAVQLILSLLLLADHPGDLAARFHVATSSLGAAIGFTTYVDDDKASALARNVRRRLIDEGYGRTIYEWVRQLSADCDERELSRLLQFVELAYGYETEATLRPRDFVELVHTQRVESPTAASVRVMTVHQSKGLQFDIVVLPELDVRLKGATPQFVVGRSNPLAPPDLICPYASAEARRFLPDRIQQFFTERETEQVTESLCVLYVAMTRAVHSLHMIVSPHDKAPTTTFAGVLRAALVGMVPLEPGTLPYQSPENGWSDAERSPSTTETPPAVERLEIRLRESTQRRRGLERRSPSSLAGGTQVRLADRLRRDTAATSRGTLFHAWLEAVAWLDDAEQAKLPDDETLHEIARRLEFADDLEDELSRLKTMLAKEPLKSLLSRSSYADPSAIGWPAQVVAELDTDDARTNLQLELRREFPFAVRMEDRLVQGVIDRLVVVRRDGRPLAADVIDFKSDRIADAASLDETARKYAPQLGADRAAVATNFRLAPERIACRLAFLDADAIRRIDG